MMRAVDIVAPSMAAQVESHTVIFLWPRTRIVCVLYGEPKSKMNVSSCSFFVELLTMKYALPCAQHHNRRYVALLKHQKEKLIYVMVDIFLVALRNGLTRESSSSKKSVAQWELRSERLKSIFLIPSIFIDAWSWIVNVAIFLFRCGESHSMRIITKGKIINIGKMVRNINVLWLLLNAHSWITPSTKREREKKIICNIHDISNLVCLSFSPCNNAQHTHNALSLSRLVQMHSCNCNWYRKDMKIPSINTSISKW